jgi:hypothetical protein
MNERTNQLSAVIGCVWLELETFPSFLKHRLRSIVAQASEWKNN